jgi:hypothetical protein
MSGSGKSPAWAGVHEAVADAGEGANEATDRAMTSAANSVVRW